ncbi:MAG: hypothetical protein PHG51_06730 [Candidatus Omnitrophica bacterium]|nr:hypothetical protein [Candidatus Omnitrophota bacterium]
MNKCRNLNSQVTVDVYGKRVCLRTNNRRFVSQIIKEYLPFFKTFPPAIRNDLTLDIICGFKNIGADLDKRNKFDPWKRKDRRGEQGNFRLAGEKVFYYRKNIGAGYWDKARGRLFFNKDNPVLGGELKYFFYTALFDWLAKNGYFMMHGCALEKDGKGILILGSASAGKSTLAFNLLRGDFNCLGDNVILIKKEQNKLFLFPFLKYISLKERDALRHTQCLRLMRRRRVYRRKHDKLSFKISDLKPGLMQERSRLSLILCPDLGGRGRALTKKAASREVKKILRLNIEEMVLGISSAEKSHQVASLAQYCAQAVNAYYIYPKDKLGPIADRINELLAAR